MPVADSKLECIVLSDEPQCSPPTSPSTTASPVGSPRCISPEAIDEKLAHYVNLFGSRWALIRCHMQVQFSVAFPARYLEKRWQMLQQKAPDAEMPTVPVRSPLACMDMAQQEQLSKLPTPQGIQERLPLYALCPPPNSKRWREDGNASPTQPARPPPPSPHALANSHPLPKGLKQGLCPTFLLAPGSALAAPDNVRRQLKAVYLASLITQGIAEQEQAPQEEQEHYKGGQGGACDVGGTCDEELVAAAASAVTKSAGKGLPPKPDTMAVDEVPSMAPSFASEEEKHHIVQLLARELECFRRSRSSTEEAAKAGGGKSSSRSLSRSPGRKTHRVVAATPLDAHRSGAPIGVSSPPCKTGSQLSRRWPTAPTCVE